MAEPNHDAEVEQVLSAIRRLIVEGPPADRAAPPGRLVLTPTLRVEPPAQAEPKLILRRPLRGQLDPLVLTGPVAPPSPPPEIRAAEEPPAPPPAPLVLRPVAPSDPRPGLGEPGGVASGDGLPSGSSPEEPVPETTPALPQPAEGGVLTLSPALRRVPATPEPPPPPEIRPLRLETSGAAEQVVPSPAGREGRASFPDEPPPAVPAFDDAPHGAEEVDAAPGPQGFLPAPQVPEGDPEAQDPASATEESSASDSREAGSEVVDLLEAESVTDWRDREAAPLEADVPPEAAEPAPAAGDLLLPSADPDDPAAGLPEPAPLSREPEAELPGPVVPFAPGGTPAAAEPEETETAEAEESEPDWPELRLVAAPAASRAPDPVPADADSSLIAAIMTAAAIPVPPPAPEPEAAAVAGVDPGLRQLLAALVREEVARELAALRETLKAELRADLDRDAP